MKKFPKKLLSKFTKYKRSQTGIVSIEFGIWCVSLLIPFLIGLEFGLFNLSKSKLTKATNAGAVTAFDNRDNIDEAYLTNVIKSTYRADDMTVKLMCNGNESSCVNTNRSCSCIESYSPNSAGGTSAPSGALQTDGVLFKPTNCASVCSSGAAPGYYLTIDVTVKSPKLLSTVISPPSTIRSVTTVKLE